MNKSTQVKLARRLLGWLPLWALHCDRCGKYLSCSDSLPAIPYYEAYQEVNIGSIKKLSKLAKARGWQFRQTHFSPYPPDPSEEEWLCPRCVEAIERFGL